MTSPLPTLPHVDLGNIEKDIGGAAGSLVQGMIAERNRRQQLAMQQALQNANIAHLGAESDLAHAQALRVPSEIEQNLGQAREQSAQGDIRLHQNEPSGVDQLTRLRTIRGYENVPDNYFQGASRADADDYIDKAMQSAASIQSASMRIGANQDKPYLVYNQSTGEVAFARPDGTLQPIQGYGKQPTGAERAMAGAGAPAKQDHQLLTRLENVGGSDMMNEVAKIISLPNIGRLLPFSSGDAAERILQQFRLMGASPEAQQYVKAMFDFAGIVGPKRYGLRGMQSTLTLQQLWTDFGAGQFGLTPEGGIHQAQANRARAIMQLEISAGPTAWAQGQEVAGQMPTDTTSIGGKRPPVRFQP